MGGHPADSRKWCSSGVWSVDLVDSVVRRCWFGHLRNDLRDDCEGDEGHLGAAVTFLKPGQ